MLLELSGVSVILDNPIILGKAVWDFSRAQSAQYQRGNSSRGLPVICRDFTPSNVEVCFHLFRSKDAAMCCMHRSKGTTLSGGSRIYVHPLLEGSDGITSQSKFDLTKDQTKNCFDFGCVSNGESSGLSLRPSREAADLVYRYPHAVSFASQVRLGVVEGGQFAITHIGIMTMRKHREGGDMHLLKDCEEAKECGVTVLHILSELQGS